ncbi:MAG: hypothetical protein FJW66_08395 [Actinobacteria bacterium]|nr:hypothetical protein [Actinomycetota bacterium]
MPGGTRQCPAMSDSSQKTGFKNKKAPKDIPVNCGFFTLLFTQPCVNNLYFFITYKKVYEYSKLFLEKVKLNLKSGKVPEILKFLKIS